MNTEEPHWMEPSPEPSPEFLPVEPSEWPTYTPPAPRYLPNFAHALLFFAIAAPVMVVGQFLAIYLLQASHLFGHKSFAALAAIAATDARYSIPVQAFSYLLMILVIAPVFSVIWHERFADGVHWNAPVARRRFLWMAGLGLAVGFGITLIGNFLPMPADPPIMKDMMKSPLGAWMMLIFGTTGAPIIEELAFRGFLLPGILNLFRARASETTVQTVGIPVSILLASIPFVLLHAAQVSKAWGPLLLIGLVSIVLCIVRLALKSVAAGVVVHAAYNFSLFAGVLAQTDGFRHLEKLTS